MKTSIALFIIILGLPLAGCYTSTGTISHEPVSYFQVSNLKPGLTALVDDNPPVTLEAEKAKAMLKVSPGKHRIRILQGQTTLVDRIVLVSDLQTLEIAIP